MNATRAAGQTITLTHVNVVDVRTGRVMRDNVDRGLIAGPRIISAGPIVENGGWLEQVRRMAKQIADTAIENAQRRAEVRK